MPRRLSIAAISWALVVLVMVIYSTDLEEALWFLYDPLLIGVVWCSGVILFAFCAIRIRRHHQALLASVILLGFGVIAVTCDDYLSMNARFLISQRYYEGRLQVALASNGLDKSKDLDGVEGIDLKRVAFIWSRGVTDNWVGLVFDPSDSLAESDFSQGQGKYF